MGHVTHWVTRINPTLVVAVAIGAAAFVYGVDRIAEAIKPSQLTLAVSINNQGRPVEQAAFTYDPQTGKWVPVPVPKVKK